MWTNVFRIGELQVVSWFQFLPSDSDLSSLPERSFKAEQKDAATHLVLSAHLQLQNDGFLSTWTNSFVGPWDPSQGVHNPDEKIKLWLFLPGRHSSITETARATVARLRVVGSGLWLAPGDSEEVALALSQALRNSIERALKGLSYMRYGDVFTRCHLFPSSINNFRRVQPTLEFIFSVSEEAIYVHAIISAKHVRGLCSDDLERVSKHRSSISTLAGLPVLVAPNGIGGRLTGCCPTDLVKQVYISKHKGSKGFGVGTPFHVTYSSGCQLGGQSCYVEVALGCPSTHSNKILESNSDQNGNIGQAAIIETNMESFGRAQQKQGLADHFPILQKTFIFPPESVLVPLMHRAFATSSLKRFWRKSWPAKSLSELWPLWNFSASLDSEHCLAFETCNDKSYDGLGVQLDGIRLQQHYNSSSNSNSSSISSVSSTSSETDHAMAIGGGDLEADADSLASRKSGLSSSDQFENDGHRTAPKRPRTGITDIYGQAGTVEANNLAAGGIPSLKNMSPWDLDDEDKGFGIDIQALLSEFGDFGDFFEDDVLSVGELPGTAESEALMSAAADCGDVSGSPCTEGMDISDQKFSPVTLTFFEGINHPLGALMEDNRSKNMEFTKDARSSIAGSHSSGPSTGAFDYVTKAEAMMSFAPEYAAVEMTTSEFSTSIFKSPYLPRSKRVESLQSSSSAYAYGVVPSSPCLDIADEKLAMLNKLKSTAVGQDANSSVETCKLYNQIEGGMKVKRAFSTEISSRKGEASSSMSGMNSANAALTHQRKNEHTFDAGLFLLSLKTVLATDIECILFQAAMCRIRHTLLSIGNRVTFGSNKLVGGVMTDLIPSGTGTSPEMMPNNYEVKKKDSIPVRIAGDADGGMLDGSLTSRVGVWRSVGAPKGTKPLNIRIAENSSSFPQNILNEDCSSIYGQRQPLEELLDAMALLVQQSTSFVDVSLDTDDGDGSYYWLALQEQRRRGFSCGPSMVHAGCGGLLATCHSVDIAGVDLIDPLSADVQVSSVIGLLQSDIKVALKTAFGSLDGPLSVIDWCRGRSQSVDSGAANDVYSFTVNDAKDSSSTVTLVGEPISPNHSTAGTSCIREGIRMDESSQRRSNQDTSNPESEQQKLYSRCRPTVAVLPLPAILVGYQDDWLKTSANCLQHWEKAPLEPYALQKPVTFYALCPDTDLLTSAAADFFLQLGTVYETCKLGTHSPQISGGGKCLPSGLVLVDCPQEVKIAGNNVTSISSVSDYFSALSKGWNVRSFVKALTKVIKDLKLSSNFSPSQKEGSPGPCTVVYIVCPFPDPTAVLHTLIESSAALGSVVMLPDRERQSFLHSQVAKALSCTAAIDETSASNVVMLSGFSIPKLVLQIVTVECLLRVNRPTNELAILKDIAFTVYNKARRIPRSVSSNDMFQPSFVSARAQSTLMHVNSPIPGLWKDCLAPRMSGAALAREGELDAALRPGTWENSWQTSRPGGLSSDPNRSADLIYQDDTRYMFEPLFILAEPGSVEHGTSPNVFGTSASESSNSKSVLDDGSGVYMQSSTSGGSTDVGTSSHLDGSDHDLKAGSLHCCYGWTEDWRWLVCIWTDSRGELLDCNIFPFGGISSRQDTKVLQSLFVQVLNHGCHIISSSSTDSGSLRPRDIIITRIGCFFELECQEWQNAIYLVGGNDVKKWPLQLRRSTPDTVPSNTNGTSLQQQDMGLIQERNLPSSPSPSLYSPRAKSSFIKGGLGQPNTKKQLLSGQTVVDSSRGLLHLVQSISLVGVSVDHSLHLILPADSSHSSGGPQNSSGVGVSGYIEGFSPVKSLGSTPASYLLIPSPNMRFLPPTPLQLPTCLTSESPPLAHLLHSKGSAIPLSTGYVVSKAVATMRKDPAEPMNEDWPSILAVTLVDHYGGGSTNSSSIQDKMGRGSSNSSISKQVRSFGPEAVVNRDYELETHLVLESVAAELHSLSWMTVSPVYSERRTALPFHCDMLLRLRRLLHYADKELSRPPEERTQTT